MRFTEVNQDRSPQDRMGVWPTLGMRWEVSPRDVGSVAEEFLRCGCLWVMGTCWKLHCGDLLESWCTGDRAEAGFGADTQELADLG